MLKLFAASAYLDGRQTTDASDFFVLKHIWNNQDQAAILEGIVQPVLEAFFREHPDRRRVGALGVGVEALAAEIDRIRQILTGGAALGDVQLFSQLKALGQIKQALAGISDPRARELEARVSQLSRRRPERFAQICGGPRAPAAGPRQIGPRPLARLDRPTALLGRCGLQGRAPRRERGR
jgi:MoxR-like ATPase